MTIIGYHVSFYGERPDTLTVGDKLQIHGTVTVKSIDADLVDITALNSDPQFTLGEITVGLVSNRLEVEKP